MSTYNAIEMDAKMEALIQRKESVVIGLYGESSTYKRRLFQEKVGHNYNWETECFNCMCNQIASSLCNDECHQCANFYINGYNPYCHKCCALLHKC